MTVIMRTHCIIHVITTEPACARVSDANESLLNGDLVIEWQRSYKLRLHLPGAQEDGLKETFS